MSQAPMALIHTGLFLFEMTVATAASKFLMNRRDRILEEEGGDRIVWHRSESVASSRSQSEVVHVRSADDLNSNSGSGASDVTTMHILTRVLADDRCWFCWWCAAVFLAFMFFNSWIIISNRTFTHAVSVSVSQALLTAPVAACEYCAVTSLVASARLANSVASHGGSHAALPAIFAFVWLLNLMTAGLTSQEGSSWVLQSLSPIVLGPIAATACVVRLVTVPRSNSVFKLQAVLLLEALSLTLRTVYVVYANYENSTKSQTLLKDHEAVMWTVFECVTIAPLALAVLMLHFWR